MPPVLVTFDVIPAAILITGAILGGIITHYGAPIIRRFK